MRARRRLFGVGMLIGGLLMLSPVVGIIVSSHQAFAALGESGIGDPGSLAGSVGELHAFSLLLLPLFWGGAALLMVSWWQRRKLRASPPPPLPPLIN